MNPWEKYAAQAQGGAQDSAPQAPWEKYRQQAAPAAPLDRLPPETSPTAQPQKNADSIANKLLGFGEAGLSAATGAAGGVAGQLYGIGKTLTGGKYGTQAGIQEGEKAGVELANKLTYQPRTQTGQQITEGVGKALEASRLQGLPVEGGMIGRIPEIPGAALRTAEGVGAANRAVGRAAGQVGQAGLRGAARALPEVDPVILNLGRQANQLGFRLRPEDLYSNKYAKIAGESLEHVPFSGADRNFNQNVMNRNLINLIGGEPGDKLTRRVFADAMDRSGQAIGDISARYDLPITPSFTSQLRANGARHTPDVRAVVDGYVQDIERSAGRPVTLAGGGRTAQPRQLDGTTFRRINTELSRQIRETGNGDLRSALSDLQDDLLEAQYGLMSEADRAAIAPARRQYAIGKTLEPLIAKSPKGDISPSLLLGAVTANKQAKSLMARGAAGDLGTLADIGQTFLKEPKSSYTAERNLLNAIPATLGGLAAGGAGAAAGLPAAAATVGGTLTAANLYNRLGPRVAEQLLTRPPQP